MDSAPRFEDGRALPLAQIGPEELKEKISEEITSHALRSAILEATTSKDDTPPEPVSKWGWTRHPLFLALLAFFLTGGVGTWLETQIANSARDAEIREAEIQKAHDKEIRARQALFELMAITNERSIRTSLLTFAIRSDPTLIAVRKANYDVAFVDWNVELDGVLFRIREALVDDPNLVATEHRFEELVSVFVDTGKKAAFNIANNCLSDALIKARQESAAFNCGIVWNIKVKIQADRARQCVLAIVAEGLRIARYNTRKSVATASNDRSFTETFEPSSTPEEVCQKVN